VYPTALLAWDGSVHELPPVTASAVAPSWDAVYAAARSVDAQHNCVALPWRADAATYPASRVQAVARGTVLPRAARAGRRTWIASRSVAPHTLTRFADGHVVDTALPRGADGGDAQVDAVHGVACAAALAGCAAVRGVCGTQHLATVQRVARKHGECVVSLSL